MPSEFTAEIISWEYPEPIENRFSFGGFALMHAGSMLAMLVIGLLTVLTCVIFVKKDQSLAYNVLDMFSIVLRRKGFRKTGFFIQLVGPVIYIVPLVVESININFFR